MGFSKTEKNEMQANSEQQNKNSNDYWNERFGTGDWEAKGGFRQSFLFAESQVPVFGLPRDFKGQICDFGCGAGDAFPVYRRYFPNAKLVGVDFSEEAINLCRKRFGEIAEFICGDECVVPISDVIICSNVFEHLTDDLSVARNLIKKCRELFIIVPYREWPLSDEHLREYNERSFKELQPIKTLVFLAKGWSYYGKEFLKQILFRNIIRFFSGKPCIRQRKQILFKIGGSIS